MKEHYHSIIQDEGLDSSLAEEGYSVVPFLNKAEVAELKEFIFSIYDPAMLPDVFLTIFEQDASLRRKIHDKIVEVCSSALERYFKDYKVPAGLFFLKKSSDDSRIWMHQDPTFVDQAQYMHIGVWIPLVDTSLENGAMWVIPGSHLFFPPVQDPTIPNPWQKIREDMLRDQAVLLEINAGDALFMDNRLLHESRPNQSGEIRPAIPLKVVHQDAQIYALYKDTTDEEAPVEVYKQTDDYILDPAYRQSGTRPSIGERIGVLDFKRHFVGEDEWMQLTGRRIKPPRHKGIEARLIMESGQESDKSHEKHSEKLPKGIGGWLKKIFSSK